MKTLTDEDEIYCRERLGIHNLRGPLARKVRELAPPLSEEELLALPLARARYLVVDLETTGMKAQRAEIMEIGAVEVNGFSLGREFQTLVNPGIPVPSFISSLTGIHDNMLIQAPGIKAVLPLLDRMLSERVLVAHNLSFDLGFLKAAWQKVYDQPLRVPALCTVKLSRRAFPELNSHNLDAAAANLGLKAEPFGPKARHRALGDARMAAALLVRVCMMLRGEGVESVADLLAFQSSRRRKKANKTKIPLPPRGNNGS